MLRCKIISAFPVILLTLLPCIYCIYFQAKQYSIWHEMEEKLEREQLQTITIPINSFHWYKKNKEVLVHGKLFDVKSIRIHNDDYIVTGLYDEQETNLHLVLRKMQARQTPGANAGLVFKLLSQQLVEPVPTLQLAELAASGTYDKIICGDEKLYTTIRSIHTPPPKS